MPHCFLENIYLDPSIKDCEEYYATLPIIKNLSESDGINFTKPVTFFVGENGIGKSTLIEAVAIAYGFNPEGGTRNFNFATKETHSGLSQHLRLLRSWQHPKDGFFLRAESFYNLASEVDDLYKGEPFPKHYGGKSLHDQSHGESFMSLVLNRFKGQGIYLLDEPESALSPTRQMALLSAIHDLVQAGSQLIIATHSPILMAYPNAQIFVFDTDGITETPYEETDHFQITKEFLNNPERMLRYLMENSECS